MKWNYQSSTPVFNEKTCPQGILNDHKVDDGYYGQLNVLSGRVIFIYLDTNDEYIIDNKKPFYIESKRLHKVKIIEPVEFRVDFYYIY